MPPQRGRPLGRSPGRAHWSRVAAVVPVIALLWLMLPMAPAQAHAELVRSEPADGQVLAAGPTVARLWFSETIVGRLSSLTLVGGGSERLPAAARQSAGDKQLAAGLPQLTSGDYGLRWKVLAADDGHTSSGTVLFSVGTRVRAASLPTGSPTVRPLPAVAEWCWFVALCVLLGGVLMTTIVLPVPRGSIPEAPDGIARARERLIGICQLAAGAGIVIVSIQFLARSNELGAIDGATMSTLALRSHWGQLMVVRIVLLVAVLVLLRRPLRSSPSPSGPLTLAVLAVALAATSAAQGHAADGGGAWLAIAVAGVHICAACAWIGSLLALLIVCAAPLRRRSDGAGTVAITDELAARFSTSALLCVGLLIASGLYGAGRQVDQLTALTASRYGQLLLLKVALLAVLLLLGLSNFRRLHPAAPATARVARRAVAVEASLGVLTVLVASLLAQSPPAPNAAVSAVSDHSSVATSGDWIVKVTINPDREGVNGFTVSVSSSRRPPLATATALRLMLLDAGATGTVVPLQGLPDGTAFGTGVLADGNTAARVELDVGNPAPAAVTVALPDPVTQARTAAAPWRRTATYSDPAALLSLASVVGVLAVVRRRWSAARLLPTLR